MFYVPTRIFFADNALERAAGRITALGSKALIVSGRNSAYISGAMEDIQQHLLKNDITWKVFDRVTENPTIDIVMEGVTELVLNECDFVIGVGGGSPIDAAKAISLVAANKTDRSDIYRSEGYKKALPIVAIPLSSGSGTEVTPYSVLTDSQHNKKAGLGSELAFPQIAVLEPKYTLSLSPAVTLNTGIDALSHLLEGIYSNKRNPVMFPIIYNGVKTIFQNLPKVLQDPRDLEARQEMMRASLYGGLVIAHASTTLQHSIGYPLTSVYGVPHGLANGIVMRSVMELYYPGVSKELDDLFASLSISREQFYEWLEALKLSIDIRISDHFIDEKLPEVLTSRNMANNPFEISEDDIRKIYYDLKGKA
jgi:alcohol dehydrogenase class IV